jgi:hypothetical protein
MKEEKKEKVTEISHQKQILNISGSPAFLGNVLEF